MAQERITWMYRLWIAVLLGFVITIYYFHHEVQEGANQREAWIRLLEKRLDNTDDKVKNELLRAVKVTTESRRLQHLEMTEYMRRAGQERAEMKESIEALREECQ
jgi:hypothetical protein